MANEQNLRPFTSDQSHEEAVKNGTAGGVASGKARREKADLRKVIQTWLESEATTDKHGNPMTGAQLMAAVAAREMAKGNSKFWELLRDTAGFKPVDKVMIADVDQDVINAVEEEVRRFSGSDGSENEDRNQRD